MPEPRVFPTLSPDDVAKFRRCRICRGSTALRRDSSGATIPFILNYGSEFAHQDCIDRVKSLGYLLPEYRAKSMS